MKTIGLLGGMSWESTVTYYQIINQTIKETLGGLHSAKCIIYSVDFAEIEHCQVTGDWQKAGLILQEGTDKLQAAGAELILLCTNTMHKVSDHILANLSVPFFHIADATALELKNNNISKAILLGTRYTMEQDFIKRPLTQQGIELIIPNTEERTELNRIIFDELCLGKIKCSSKEYFTQVIARLKKQGGEGVILGCTEIGLLIHQEDCPIPVIDTAIVHAKTAALKSLE